MLIKLDKISPNVYFQDVEEINQQALKIQLRLTFRFYWSDQRLTKLNSVLGNNWQDIKLQTARDNIFIPDLYLYQLVKQTSNFVFGRPNEAFYIGPNSTLRLVRLLHFLRKWMIGMLSLKVIRFYFCFISDLVSPFEHEIQIQTLNIEKSVIALHFDYLE